MRTGSGRSLEGAVVAGGRDGGELVVLEAHDAQLAADALAHVEGAIERVVVENPAKIVGIKTPSVLLLHCNDHQFHRILVRSEG